ncbi:MAG: hypothetical protein GXP43_00585 [bacterium]|nr:hypothetical protein [bacterium]
MRQNLLADIITSKARIKLLILFFSQPKEMFFVRQITRQIDEEINAVRRELDRFHKAKLLIKQQRGNRLFYWLNPKHPFYPQLQAMVAKVAGLGKDIIYHQRQLGQVKYAFISRRLLDHEPYSDQAVDVGFIGRLILPEITALISKHEKHFQREINYTILTPEELRILFQKRDPFTIKLLIEPKIMIIGDQKEMTNDALFKKTS